MFYEGTDPDPTTRSGAFFAPSCRLATVRELVASKIAHALAGAPKGGGGGSGSNGPLRGAQGANATGGRSKPPTPVLQARYDPRP